jgi:hypothetical protein
MNLTKKQLDSFKTDGCCAIDDLAKMAELMGYGGQPQQLQLNNGCFVSSIISFFEDNPGAIEAIHNWVREEYESEIAENSNACDNGGCEDTDCEHCFDDNDEEE